MARNVSAKVGVAAPNLPSDVRLVKFLLNLVPAARGGASTPFDDTPEVTSAFVEQIRIFQGLNKCTADGRIDPGRKTMTTLDDLAGGTAVPSGWTPSLGATQASTTDIGALRDKICEIGLKYAGEPYGSISDKDTIKAAKRMADGTFSTTETEEVRKGWELFKKIVEETRRPWSPDEWKNAVNWNGIRLPGHRMQGDLKTMTPKGNAHWCGIFAVWVWKQAGKDTFWNINKPSSKYVAGNKGLQKGDIGNIEVGNHHFIILKNEGGKLTTLNGNSDYQSILVKEDWPKLSDVRLYYSAAD